LPDLRICNRCGKGLPVSDFYSPPSGMRYTCKKCDLAYSKEWRRAHPEFIRQYYKDYARKNPRRRWAIACLAGHRRRGYAIEMLSSELYQLALKTDVCFVCGRRLDWGLGSKGRMNMRSPTLDRVDNERVIRRDNIAILCYQCNATKRERTLKEFYEYCSAVVARFHSHFE
jgi:hypothetical protein